MGGEVSNLRSALSAINIDINQSPWEKGQYVSTVGNIEFNNDFGMTIFPVLKGQIIHAYVRGYLTSVGLLGWNDNA